MVVLEMTVLHSDHFTVYHDDWLSLFVGIEKLDIKVKILLRKKM